MRTENINPLVTRIDSGTCLCRLRVIDAKTVEQDLPFLVDRKPTAGGNHVRFRSILTGQLVHLR